MSDESRRKKTDLVLSNGEYAFTQDATTGAIKVLTGPTVVNVTGQEYPVLYDDTAKRFKPVDLEDASQKSPMAAQGFYIELWNPPATETGAQPHEGSKEIAPALLVGRRVNIPGPTTFSLWPQQEAKVIEGHHLRSNQYLLGRVYDEEAAKENWQKAVLKRTIRKDEDAAADGDGPQGTISELTEDDLSVGKLFVIKGTEVSFYIPPTGVEVVPDADGKFVRDALTLERLQYCILVDENGDKDYQRGPKVVFPKPTQRFYADPKTCATVFRPTELNPIQGIHVKVIAPYEEGGRTYSEGEELFITGKETSIYFPRPEHSLIRYDGSAKHFATAVPEGEARYVMNRTTGEIRMVHGPTMLLPDPRHEVIVRRVLTQDECKLWYPANEEAERYNAALRTLLGRTPSTRSTVSEGEVRRSGKKGRRGADMGMADTSSVHSTQAGPVADEWTRAASYNEPRTLTLDTKFGGVPTIQVWAGYAVMVVKKSGVRRVEIGPKTVQLDYDEALEVLKLSTGLPKSTEKTMSTVYLKRAGNRGKDIMSAETQDQVVVSLKYAVTIDFVGEDPQAWFAEKDYVKVVAEATRKKIKTAMRKVTVEAFFEAPDRILQEAVLASNDLGVPGIVVTDIEVVSAKIAETKMAKMLEEAQAFAVSAKLELKKAQAELEAARAQQAIARAQAEAEAETEKFRAELAAQAVHRDLELATARYGAKLEELTKEREEQQARDQLANEREAEILAREKRSAEQEASLGEVRLALKLRELSADTDAQVARFKAAEGPLAEAIATLGNQEVLAKVAEAVSAQRLFGGQDVADVVGKLFVGTPLEDVFQRVQTRSAPAAKNGTSR